MKKTKNKILSGLIALSMVIGMLPMTAIPVQAADSGAFTITDGDLGTDYTYENGVLSILNGTALTIANTAPNTPTTDTIVVSSGVTANITLSGVNIDVSATENACAFEVLGTANITLADSTTNTLKSGYSKAGLQVETGATVTIDGTGTLNTTGGEYGAGIGGGDKGDGGTINISSGTIIATGGEYGAGIGGGFVGKSGAINISGGIITATGGKDAAGIGGGDLGGAGPDDGITITGTPIIAATAGSDYGVGLGGYDSDGVAIINTLKYVDSASAIDHNSTFTTATGSNVKFSKRYATVMPVDTQITVKSIAMKSTNHKTQYFVGDILDVNNLVISSTYTHGIISDVPVTADMVSGFDSSQEATGQVLTIEYSGQVTTYTVDILSADGRGLIVTNGTLNEDYTYRNGILDILTDTSLIITNTDPNTATSDRIVTKSSVANITLNGVNINAIGNSSAEVAFEVWNTANITLAEGTTNTLVSGDNWAGLQAIEDKTVTIDGTGALNATGGSKAAGIGGGIDGAAGTITINSGTIVAKGGSGGAGIGGGGNSQGGLEAENTDGVGLGGIVTINGGIVTAQGGSSGAGIGGGDRANNTTTNIYGGTVTATGGVRAAGIGGGAVGMINNDPTQSLGLAGNVTIQGGVVTAKGGYEADGIGTYRHWAGVNFPGNFSTGDNGTAIIYAHIAPNMSESSNWSCINFNDRYSSNPVTGTVYGNQTLTRDLEIIEGQILIVPTDNSLTVPSGITLTNIGALTNDGTITNNGTFINDGTISGSGTLNGDGDFKTNVMKVEYITGVQDRYDYTGNVINVEPIAKATFLGKDFIVTGWDFVIEKQVDSTNWSEIAVQDAANYRLRYTKSGSTDVIKPFNVGADLVEMPSIVPNGGNFDNSQNVEITTTTEGATIYYTTNGDTPTTSSTEYSGSFNVTDNTTVKAIAVKDGMTNSHIASATFTKNAQLTSPIISPDGGNFDNLQSVTITTTEDATIYYTTDGSDPTTSSTVYNDSFNVTETTTVKAIAVKSGSSNSDITSVTFTKNAQLTAPTISPNSALFDSSLNVEITAVEGATIYYTTDGSNPTTSSIEYNNSFNITADTTVKAIAVKVGFSESAVASATFTKSSLIVTGGSFGVDYNYENGVLNILTDTPLTIQNADIDTATIDRIVTKSLEANITLAGVNIQPSGKFPVALEVWNTANITLAEGTTNTLVSGENWAGLQVIEGRTVTIDGKGVLNATGGNSGAGIGGGYEKDGGTINITDGEINATGGTWGAGIGGGYKGDGGTINIASGIVTATGGSSAAGIGGGGYKGDGAEITITGTPIITATGGISNLNGLHDTTGITIANTLIYADSKSEILDSTVFTTGDGSNVTFANKYTKVMPAAASITIKTPATKTEYLFGDSLDVTGLVITATYPNGSTKDITVTAGMITGFDSSSVTESQTLTITYGGKTANYAISIVEPTVTAIAVKSTNHKTEYYVGNNLDVRNLVITATYENDTTRDIHVNADMVSGFNSASATESQTLTISYGGKTASYTVNITEAPTYDLTVTGGSYGVDYTYENGVLNILTDTPLTIKNADIDTATSDRIVTESSVANITLAGVNIRASGSFPVAFEVWNTANITLSDGTTNTLQSGANWAGLQVIVGKTVTIDGTGTLNAIGGTFAAGIGGGDEKDGGTINITDGEINATGGTWGAGIGGGYQDDGGTINISGGIVTATGGSSGTGIGGGLNGDGAEITITGTPTITASGASDKLGLHDDTGIEIANSLQYADSTSVITDSTTFTTGDGSSVTFASRYAKVMPVVDSIAIKTHATKTEYFVGDSLDVTDLVITATYPNGLTQDVNVTAGMVSGFHSSSVTESQTLIISYGGKTASYTISIVEPTVTSIAVKSTNHRTEYYVGNNLDVRNLVITATYENNTTRDVNVTADMVSGFDSSAVANDQTLTITYKEQTTSYIVDIVEPTATSIEVKSTNHKTDYYTGDELDVTDLVITATYSDNSTGDVNVTADMVSGFNSASAVNGQTLTITYGGQTTTYTVNITEAPTYDLTVTGGSFSSDYTYENGVLTILTDTALTIKNADTNTPTQNTIVIPSGKTANLTLSGVNIDVSATDGACAFEVLGTANITLEDSTTNNLKSGVNKAGLQVGAGATATIDGTGTLNATSGSFAAGIGGANNRSGGTITINGGTINAINTGYAAGIGGGYNEAGGTIAINGGTINATSTSYGAGIGGGYQGDGGTIIISDTSKVTAKGGNNGAGIGGGGDGSGGTITINDGTVTATGGDYAAGIGGGLEGAGGTITINDGTVTATSIIWGAGIGGGDQDKIGGTVININGGTIIAKTENTYDYGGAGIGGGGRGGLGAQITITGTPTITATGGLNGKGLYDIDTITIANTLQYADSTSEITDSTVFTTGDGSSVIFANRYAKVMPADEAPTTYTLTVTSGTGSGDYVENADVTITATVPSGKQFTSWTINGITVSDNTQNPLTFQMPTNAVTATANFEDIPEPKYALTVTNGTGDGDYVENASVEITATVPSGQRFVNWTSDNGGTFDNANNATTTFTMPANAVTATANFEDIPEPKYALTVTNGTGSGEYVENASVEITATVPSGKQFTSWTSDNGGTFANSTSATTTFTMPANATTVTANLEDIPVSITSVEVSPTTVTVQKGQTQQFTKIVLGTGNFDDTVTWSVSGGTGTTAIDTNGLLTVDANETATSLTVTATSNEDDTKTATAVVTITDEPVTTHTITASAGENGSISPTGAQSVSEDGSITFTFTPDSGFEVYTVTVDGSEVAKANSYTFDNVSTNHTINVTFKKIKVVIIPQEISYNTTTITKTEGDGVFTNQLTETTVDESVSYESSNPKVATVDGNGEVTIVGVGTATITATAEQTATHSEATASYTLTVNTGEVNVDENEVTIFDADFKDFQDVKITVGSNTTILTRDDKYLTGYKGYTFNNGRVGEVNPGSVEVTLYKEFLATLPEGEYSLAITTTGGTSAGTITGTIPTKETHNVTINANGGTGATANTTVQTGDIVTVSAGTRDGYTFKDWTVTGGVTVQNNQFIMLNEDVTLTANWTQNSTGSGGSSGSSGGTSTTYYDIEIDIVGEGEVTPDGGSDDIEKVAHNTDKTFEFEANKDYIIAYVLVDGKSVGDVSSYTFKDVEKDHTLKVVFEKEDETSTNPFIDVKSSDWFYNDVMYVYKNGLMTGTSDDEFSPSLSATRSMIWTVLARMSGVELQKTDVWYEAGQNWAMENGVSDGTNPNGNITREELVTMLYRFEAPEILTTQTLLGQFSDKSEISEYAVHAMEWAVANGIITGKTENTLDPKGNATRAEIAAIMHRYLEMK